MKEDDEENDSLIKSMSIDAILLSFSIRNDDYIMIDIKQLSI